MAKTAYINARIEPDVKEQAEKVFTAVGISASDAVGLFYRQVVLRQGLPFDVAIPNAATTAALEEIDRGGGEIIHGPTDQLFDELD
ncbi:MAG: type II toxin-antitoxin system RelB/DinJ family antitoxin [Xanthobacteraceae bacterium]|nr:type II toxin-antitoxin system RelB/DinJ family antitoxin [Xanthobacteraceae bacterium]